MKTIIAASFALLALTIAGTAFAGQEYGNAQRDNARLGLITPHGILDGR